ncbi:hypothetical protein Gasu2_48090 [Galdieria sulphuraria]|uniref:Uncharacterized protein n=1 Tax=Galdieria sulphuraria TaxID=130081 RepID=M2WSR7_GALSU|nr:uncharacterized protein Gasu_54770 [Galdieria sulphuraria]EME26905.1 hypothetical protein Gasu_54770 [Galdieria sulphuraria]GJD10629.1 hypothetical protein Gasu2_48090 [Galdieria sulphuraria]|eukprot:XP_005703425.1 hypothetical protein Gasu_54770 [Galdieria sulphuraria]
MLEVVIGTGHLKSSIALENMGLQTCYNTFRRKHSDFQDVKCPLLIYIYIDGRLWEDDSDWWWLGRTRLLWFKKEKRTLWTLYGTRDIME